MKLWWWKRSGIRLSYQRLHCRTHWVTFTWMFQSSSDDITESAEVVTSFIIMLANNIHMVTVWSFPIQKPWVNASIHGVLLPVCGWSSTAKLPSAWLINFPPSHVMGSFIRFVRFPLSVQHPTWRIFSVFLQIMFSHPFSSHWLWLNPHLKKLFCQTSLTMATSHTKHN